MEILKIIRGSWQSNSYIIFEDNEENSDTKQRSAAIVDPSDSISNIMDILKEKNARLNSVLLTHGHFDHIISVEQLYKKTGAVIYMHKNDFEFLSDPEKSYFKQFLNCDIKIDVPVSFVEDGSTINLGKTEFINVLHTPGHTAGSVCYYIEDSMFTGDTIFYRDVGGTSFYSSNEVELQESIHKLALLKNDYTIYPGHGRSSTLKKEVSYYI